MVIPAQTVHNAFLAALQPLYANVMSTKDFLHANETARVPVTANLLLVPFLKNEGARNLNYSVRFKFIYTPYTYRTVKTSLKNPPYPPTH